RPACCAGASNEASAGVGAADTLSPDSVMLRLAVVLPMYNEQGNVAALLERLAAVRERSGLDLVALAVDDGSRDATYDRLVELAPRFAFLRIVRHTRNRGMAAALRT